MATEIRFCTCAHTFQDKKYGKNQRVHNSTGKKRQAQGINWRCSVCGREK